MRKDKLLIGWLRMIKIELNKSKGGLMEELGCIRGNIALR